MLNFGYTRTVLRLELKVGGLQLGIGLVFSAGLDYITGIFH